MGIPFTMVFLCENVQLALTVSPRIATDIYIYIYIYYVRAYLKWAHYTSAEVMDQVVRNI